VGEGFWVVLLEFNGQRRREDWPMAVQDPAKVGFTDHLHLKVTN